MPVYMSISLAVDTCCTRDTWPPWRFILNLQRESFENWDENTDFIEKSVGISVMHWWVGLRGSLCC